MVQKFLKLAEVQAATGLSKSTVYRLGAQGKFPKPVKLDERASAWIEAEIEEWQRRRIAERDSGAGPPAPRRRAA